MPGFVTHYLWGRETYQRLKASPLKKNLYYNRAAFGLGLQGPDFIFYYLPSYVLHRKALGSLAHTTNTQAFYANLLESRNLFHKHIDRHIAEAYLIGFLGHYTLDTNCHPFIYGRTGYHGRSEKAYFSRHAYLETDIDTDLLASKLNLTPSAFYGAETLTLTARQKRVIATMLHYAFQNTYPGLHTTWFTMYISIFSMQFGMFLLHDDSGQKKVLIRWLEKHFLKYPLFSPLIPSDSLFFRTDPFNMRHKPWKNPWDNSHTSTESFFDLYEKAGVIYERRIRLLTKYFYQKSSPAEKELQLKTFLNDYGNNSMHSGMDASIPS